VTTIACNKEVMAGDSRLTGSSIANAVKVFKHKGRILGVSGTYGEAMDFVRWWKAGCPVDDEHDPPNMQNVAALCLLPDGTILVYDQQATPYSVIDGFAAVGSGESAALGAMYAGADPIKAVKIAAKVDQNTGGKVIVRRLKRVE
jgi:ATP-dependent protease HslVU (ClpYQ) peptidase subunit